MFSEEYDLEQAVLKQVDLMVQFWGIKDMTRRSGVSED